MKMQEDGDELTANRCDSQGARRKRYVSGKYKEKHRRCQNFQGQKLRVAMHRKTETRQKPETFTDLRDMDWKISFHISFIFTSYLFTYVHLKECIIRIII